LDLSDKLLAQLREHSLPHDLAAFDDAVLAGVRERKQMGSMSRKALGTCGALALGVGLAGGAMAGGAVAAQEPVLALSSADMLAPSTLLEGTQ
jgi:hypothetical protein